jgi:hypothetical protein
VDGAIVRLVTTAMVFVLGGCDLVGVSCSTDIRWAVQVDVVDAITLEGRADGATLTLRDGEWSETVTESWDGRRMDGAPERAGRYDVSVDRPGYLPWNESGVSVGEDECHVQTVSLEARLIPDLSP